MYKYLYRTIISRLPDRWVETLGGPYYRIMASVPRKEIEELPVNIAGIRYPNPIGMPAGWIDTPQKLKTAHKLDVGIPTIKTITLKNRKGNPYPRIIRKGDTMINSMGLPNNGVDWWVKNFKPPAYPIIISVKGNTFSEWEYILEQMENLSQVFELNLSCPNVGKGIIDLRSSKALVRDIASITDKQIFLKLSPEYSGNQNLSLVDKVRSDITGITALNTLPVRHEGLGNPNQIGGISGKELYTLLQRQLMIIREAYPDMEELPIFATGGIMKTNKAWEVLLKYRAIPMGLTGFLTEGPNFYRDLLEGVRSKLSSIGRSLKEVIYL